MTVLAPAEATSVAVTTTTPTGTAPVPTVTTAITNPPLPHAPATLLETQPTGSACLDMALDLQTGAVDATAEHHVFAKNARNKGRPALELDEPDTDGRLRKTTAVPLQHGVQGHASGPPTQNERSHMEEWPALAPGASAGKLR